MELKDYLDLLRKRWWLPLVSVFVVGLIGYLLTPAPEILYRSTVKVLLNQSRVAIPDENTIREAQRIANTYAELMKVDRVIALVRQNVDSPSGVGDIRSRIEVDVVPNTNIMNISVEDPDPQMAADIANELVAVFIQQVEAIEASNYRVSIRELEEQISDVQVELDQVQADLSAAEDRVAQLEAAAGISAGQDGGSEIAEARRDRNQLQAEYDQLSRRYDSLLNSLQELNVLNAQEAAIMTVVEDAGRGTRVTPRPQRLVNALQGALGGLVIGLGGVFLLEQLRVNIKSSREIERIAGMGTLGVIATIKGSNTEDKLVAARRPRSPIAEAYRVLRTNIEITDPDNTPRTLVKTSASAAEGKTVTAVNLATTFAQSGKRVILVDADLRRPALHKILGVTNSYGLSTALLREQGES
ncbi:MAG: YveK family protein, partial [Anaerolineae bacterium]